MKPELKWRKWDTLCVPSSSLCMHTRAHAHSHLCCSSVFVLQDRVMINRMDNICEAVMKGKWPFNRRQFFDFPGLLPGYSSMTTDSPLQRRSLGDLSMVGQTSYSGSEDLTMSPQVNKASPTYNAPTYNAPTAPWDSLWEFSIIK